MKLHLPVVCTLLLIGSCNSSNRENRDASGTQPPHIILIMADDMGFECLSAYGSLSYHTPRLDRIAEEGILATRCISNPLCTPSRVKIMTGLHNYRNYEHFGYLNPDEYTFGNLLKEAGYQTCIVGKWQLNGIYHSLPGNQDLDRPHVFGFDEYCLWQVHKGKKEGERYAGPLIVQNGQELDRDPDAYGPDVFLRYALSFIERNQDQPFFLYYPMVLVHSPFVPTPDSKAWENPERRYEKDTAYFRDMVAYTDKIVGQLADKLERLGIAENTLLIFTGDNGTHKAIHTRTKTGTIQGGKGETIDAGVHVPLVMQWPAMIDEPIVYDGIIEFSDFFPTFAEIAGREVTSDGKSFYGLLAGTKYDAREYAFVHYDPRWGNRVNQFRNRFLQNRRYKLYHDSSFYDLETDRLEQNPIPYDSLSQLNALRDSMHALLNEKPAWTE